ncbi:ABC transporter substrate-binding protein [Corynebacterium felinum]|uniref:Iron complex transport system substrate-binding protein n=1 Tax=Corynebacterium felinum TaxID=131318 RepID=A0ABU2B9X4_9CORY|nr:ABC transporter substrate-binding protein [Corynebacterium felinum]MDF5821766.1 ABC transporter substrate-binding protein [Corynebacterium felinum]MDR7355427.1 iron complex transport system substrate-binding protein [Corynebacterium felinum]WJY94778.1 putative siderophore-binding lipoprotein YfiY precursor [Corynebacterium felinum]
MSATPWGSRELSRRGFLSAAGLVGLGMLAGCATSAPAGDTGTVLIHHSMGDTTITGVPQRVVTLGNQWTDALLTLGGKPVGFFDSVHAAGGGLAPWTHGQLEGATEIVIGESEVVDQVRRLEPDLIIAPGFAADTQTYESFAAIAPTIPDVSTAQIGRWQDPLTLLGQILRVPEVAERVISDLEGRLAEDAATLKNLQGKKLSMVYFYKETSIGVQADPSDGASEIFLDFGMSFPENQVARAGGSGRFEIPVADITELESDVLIIILQESKLRETFEAIPGFPELSAVRKSQVQFIDLATGTALNVPTVLSIPFALDRIKPLLKKVR